MAKVHCPRITCRSTSCVPVRTNKTYSSGRGIIGGAVGGLVFGPIGAAAGLASGLNGKRKVKFVCNKCGHIFDVVM